MLPWLEGTFQEHTGTDFTSHSPELLITVLVISFFRHVVDTFVLNLCYFHVRQRHPCFHWCWYFSTVVYVAFILKSEGYNNFLTSHLMLSCFNCDNTDLHWSAAIQWINHLLTQTQTNLLCYLEPRWRCDSSLDGKAVLNTLLFSNCYFWPNSALKNGLWLSHADNRTVLFP